MAEDIEISEEVTFVRPAIKGRGTSIAPTGRFEKLGVEMDPEAYLDNDPDMALPKIKTEVFKDSSRTVLTTNDSPDIGMDMTLNPYRGCEHGCIYCYARPTHEYLGMSSGIDFETKIFAKTDAPELLRARMAHKNWRPLVVTMSGITDCYQPLERKMQITRNCLKVFADFRNPVVIITKNFLVTRDIDVLQELAKYNCAHVCVSITSLNKDLIRALEPRTATPALKLKVIELLSKAGIPVSVNMAPIIPGLTDHEIPSLLEAAANAGAYNAHFTIVRLPYAVKDLFTNWLDEHEPLKKEKILNRIRSMRGGKLYDAKFGTRMRGEGLFAEQIEHLFNHSKKRFGLGKRSELTTKYFRNPAVKQLSLFDQEIP